MVDTWEMQQLPLHSSCATGILPNSLAGLPKKTAPVLENA
jgi:hypothetical protein